MALLGAILATLAGLALTTLGAETATAASLRADEPALKAVLLLNVARFTQWADQGRERSLCLIGDDPFGEVLGEVARLSAERWGDDTPYAVRHLEKAEQATRCAVVFIGASETDRLERLLDHPALAGALIAGDLPRFAERGGTLGLVRRGNRLRFVVNLDGLCRHHLTISAQALELAITLGEGRCQQ
ncbi:YfiR family protein [Endothiovibrio diazotrophicus]